MTNNTHQKILEWADTNANSYDEGITCFVSASLYMAEGIVDGVLCEDDLLFWVQGAQRSNSYGEADATYAAMKQFEKIVSENIE